MQYTGNTPVAPRSTTTEDMGNGRRIVRDEWRSGDYTLVRETFHGKTGAQSPRWTVIAASHEIPGINDMSRYHDAGPTFGVNWNAMGTYDVEGTKRYAYALLRATDASNHFNAIVESHN